MSLFVLFGMVIPSFRQEWLAPQVLLLRSSTDAALKHARYSGNVQVLMQTCDVSSQDAVHSLAGLAQSLVEMEVSIWLGVPQ